MENIAPPVVENLPRKQVEESIGTTEIGGNEEHDDCYVIGFTDDDDEDEGYCYVIDHSNHREDYLISQHEVIADEGYDNGDEDDSDESDYDDVDTDDDFDEYEDDSDDDSCYEIDPTEFSQKISIQLPDDALTT